MAWNWKDEVYNVLVEECGAPEGQRDAFRFHWPDCIEYRFVGSLGMGGKIWAANGRVYVNCYREDETPERRDMMLRANNRLDEYAARLAAVGRTGEES